MEDLVQHLKGLLKSVAEDEKYENYKITAEQITSGGANCSSYLFRALISAPGKEDLRLFSKVAGMGEKMRETGVQMFDREPFFYTKLLKIYRKLEQKYVSEEDRILTPKYCKHSNEYLKETLLLEDLNSTGFLNFDRFKSVTWDQAARSVQELAKLHALSLALSKKDPQGYETVAQSIPTNFLEVNTLKNFLGGACVRVLEATREDDRERVAKFIKNTLNDKNIQYLVGPIRKSIIIHGDYKPNNLMYKIENGTCKIVPLDFQMLHYGSPLYDLLYFINLGCDAQFCQQHFQALINHYYSELCKILHKFDVDPKEAYSREDFDYEFKQILPYAVLMGFCTLLVITVDEDSAPVDLGNLEIKDFAFAPNEHYTTRLRGFIQFYTQLEVL